MLGFSVFNMLEIILLPLYRNCVLIYKLGLLAVPCDVYKWASPFIHVAYVGVLYQNCVTLYVHSKSIIIDH